MKPSVYKIQCQCDGELFVLPKPSGEWLDDDIPAYRSIGIGKIISLLTEDEVQELGLLEESGCCTRHGIDFVEFPILDRGLPDPIGFAELVRRTHADLTVGSNIGVHCRAGIGRSGMFASCLLKRISLTADEAIAVVSAARGIDVPDTEEQHRFIQSFVPDH